MVAHQVSVLQKRRQIRGTVTPTYYSPSSGMLHITRFRLFRSLLISSCDRELHLPKEDTKRDQKSLNLVVYNRPEEGEAAKTRRQALKTLTTEISDAVETALNKYDDKGVKKKVLDIPVAAERLGKFVADHTKPRPV